MGDRLILLRFGHLLTVKELQVLQLVARGLSQREIALAVGVSRSSVVSRIETGRRRLSLAVAESEALDEQDRVVVVEGGDRPEERTVVGGDRDGGGRRHSDAVAGRDAGGGRGAAARRAGSGARGRRRDPGNTSVTSDG